MFVCITVFCGIYVVHGLLKELEYEIYMFVCAAAFVLLYCIVEYIANASRRSDIKLVVFCMFLKASLALSVICLLHLSGVIMHSHSSAWMFFKSEWFILYGSINAGLKKDTI